VKRNVASRLTLKTISRWDWLPSSSV